MERKQVTMLKLIALFKFRPGMSREEGIEYYENRHVPLILELFPDSFVDYRRNYLEGSDLIVPEHVETAPPPPGIDMMTELWFETRDKFDAMIAAMGDPQVGGRVAADEENFLDRTSMTMFLVDERRTERVPAPAREG